MIRSDTPGQSSKTSALRSLLPDIIIIGVLVFVCGLSGSLFIAAVTTHAIVMTVRDTACVLVFHQHQQHHESRYEFGTGKLEQALNLAIAAAELLLGLSFIRLLFFAQETIGPPLSQRDLSLLALATLLYTMRCADVLFHRSSPSHAATSPIAYAAKVRLLVMLLLQMLVTLAAVSTNEAVADTILAAGVFVVASVLILSSVRQTCDAVLDLVDHPLDVKTDDRLQSVLERFEPTHIDIVDVRSRRSGAVPFVEVTVSAEPHHKLERTRQQIAELRQSVLEVLPGSDIVVRVRL